MFFSTIQANRASSSLTDETTESQRQIFMDIDNNKMLLTGSVKIKSRRTSWLDLILSTEGGITGLAAG